MPKDLRRMNEGMCEFTPIQMLITVLEKEKKKTAASCLFHRYQCVRIKEKQDPLDHTGHEGSQNAML